MDAVDPFIKGYVIGGTQAAMWCLPILFLMFAFTGSPILAAFCIPQWFLCLYMNTEAKKWK